MVKPLANGENPRREGHRPWNTAAAVQLSSNCDRIALRLNREATPCDMAPNTRDTKTASALYRPQPPAEKHRDARLENTASGDTNHRLEMICDESQQLDGARLPPVAPGCPRLCARLPQVVRPVAPGCQKIKVHIRTNTPTKFREEPKNSEKIYHMSLGRLVIGGGGG